MVTGGAGFLGSHFVHYILGGDIAQLVNLDALTYAGDLQRLADLEGDSRYRFVNGDVCSEVDVRSMLAEFRPDAVVHYAADSHVTRSESDPDQFYRTNVEGTRVVFEGAVATGVRRVVHVSTDEVYGSIVEGAFREGDKLPGDGQASSPYAKSKALADDLARSYSDKLEVIVARPTNAFGAWQFPEKVFPRWVTRAMRGEPLLVWGDGLYVRQWLYAEDFARAIKLLLEEGEPGEVYNVGPRHEPEITNLDLARWLVDYLGLPEDRIEMTAYDRPAHDRRYAVDSQKIRAFGWEPGDVWAQMTKTVEWYRSNPKWWERHIAEAESIYSDSKK